MLASKEIQNKEFVEQKVRDAEKQLNEKWSIILESKDVSHQTNNTRVATELARKYESEYHYALDTAKERLSEEHKVIINSLKASLHNAEHNLEVEKQSKSTMEVIYFVLFLYLN